MWIEVKYPTGYGMLLPILLGVKGQSGILVIAKVQKGPMSEIISYLFAFPAPHRLGSSLCSVAALT